MLVTIETHWADVCIEVLAEQFDSFSRSSIENSHRVRSEIVYQFSDDALYNDLRDWGADALACGLIFGFRISRQSFDPIGNRPLHAKACETCGQVRMLVGGQCEECIRLGMIE